MNTGDLLSRWMAEISGGSTGQFKAKFQWLASTENKWTHSTAPSSWLRDTAALGHLEVDWAAEKWRAAPLVVTRIPAGDGLALLCGLRTAVTDELLGQSGAEIHQIEQHAADGELPRPSALYIQYEPGTELGVFAKHLRATYVPCAAEQLTDRVPLLSAKAAAAPPARDNQTVKQFDPQQMQWETPANRQPVSGAYQFTVFGHKEFRWHEDGTWWRTDLSGCVYLALSHARISALTWRPEGPASRTGQLITVWGAPLPPLHQRAAVLCSGLMPRLGKAAKTVIYENVPQALARRIADSLNQRLVIGELR